MKTEYIFYTIGTVFAIAAVVYFTWEYFFQLGRAMKITVLLLLSVMLYHIANELRRKDL